MIYVNNLSTEVIIPKYRVSTPYFLKLRNNLTNQELKVEVEDTTPDKLVYTFSIALGDLTTGEYTYTVLDEEEKELAEGLMMYGEFNRDRTEYQSDNNIITYEG